MYLINCKCFRYLINCKCFTYLINGKCFTHLINCKCFTYLINSSCFMHLINCKCFMYLINCKCDMTLENMSIKKQQHDHVFRPHQCFFITLLLYSLWLLHLNTEVLPFLVFLLVTEAPIHCHVVVIAKLNMSRAQLCVLYWVQS